MNRKSWIIFTLIVVTIVGGMVYMSAANKKQLDVSNITVDQAARILPAEKRSGNIEEHTIGNKDAKVVLIEYGDYQCPSCRTTSPEIKRVAEQYKDNVLLIFRNFPLAKLHPNARAAAAVAEAAGQQGKFWQMHDLLYTTQESWSGANLDKRGKLFTEYANQLELDINKFNADVSADNIITKIDFDIAIGQKQNIEGTPTLIINGNIIKFENTLSIETAVKTALNDAGIKTDTPTDK